MKRCGPARLVLGALVLCEHDLGLWGARGASPRYARASRAGARFRRDACSASSTVTAVKGRLAWADALVVGVPEFAKPLRSRVGPEQALRRSERTFTLAGFAGRDAERTR